MAKSKKADLNKDRAIVMVDIIEANPPLEKPIDETYIEVDAILTKLKGKGSANPAELKELYAAYRKAFNRNETLCSTCNSVVARVYESLKKWYAKKTEELNNE